MLLRKPKVSDIDSIKRIAPQIINERFVESAVVEGNNGILSVGFIRSNMEAVFYATGSQREKIESLKLLLKKAEEETKKYGYTYLDIHTIDENFAKILVKHFGYKENHGHLLIKDLL